ncbi:hypothetical protein N7478_000529 [Penicillium angulare]|uniref:uncharacterized protein n=1 Tax=Penicillium angulare TaxID=116970 RepID=UPI00254139C5|nr:uncharacterized protein N7478_000529 [Penicillium angulare]KAJ5291278.1 hypothetical protein N7478_000529 [Penicillium angulare]
MSSDYLPSSGSRPLPHLLVILRLEPGDPRCSGYAPSVERRCLKHTNSHGRQAAERFLEFGTKRLYAGGSINNMLDIIAGHMLCSTHKSQSRDLAARWKEKVQPYAEIWLRSSSHLDLQPVSEVQSSSVDRQSIPHLSSILNLNHEKNHTCAGYAPSRGQPCRNRIGDQNRTYVMHLLAVGTTGIQRGERIDLILEDVALHVLCNVHKRQMPGLVRLWKTRVEPFIQHPATIFTRCLSRRPQQLNQSLDTPFEVEDVSPERSFTQTRNRQSAEGEASRISSNLASEDIHLSDAVSGSSESTSGDSENESPGSDSEIGSPSESTSSEASSLENSNSQTETAPLLPSSQQTETASVSDTKFLSSQSFE